MTMHPQKLESLVELAVILTQQSDFSEILRVVSSTASTLFDAKMASIIMVNPGTQNTVKTVIRKGDSEQETDYRFLQTNIIGWAMKHQQSFFSENLITDRRFASEISQKFNASSAMCVPLQNASTIIGYLLVVENNTAAVFQDEDCQLLAKMAAIAAPFLDKVQKIQSYFDKQLPDSALISKFEALGMLGKSQPYIDLLKSVEAAARCDVRVSLTGKSGTGKERVARAIHQLSSRSEQPFIAIDCGAIPETLIESELFGHVKGAFTGANFNRTGLLEAADGGTFFMDEIANLPYDMQAKLLRVLQEGEIRTIGSNTSRKINVRVIAASSSDLRDLVAEGRFREDLFYRLHVYPIEVPTLNERKADIPILAAHFMKKFAKEQDKPAESFHGYLLDYMQIRHWQGNIRELENFVERLITLAPREMVVLDHSVLPKEFQADYQTTTYDTDSHALRKSLQESMADTEKELIRKALVQAGWNQSKAARALQISERAIRYKMEKLGISKADS